MNDERSKIIKELLNIVSIEDEKEQAEKIVNLVADLVQGIGCVLYKLDETSENIKPIASTKDWFKELINKGIAVKYPKSIGLTGWIFNTAKPLLIDNTSKFVIERNGWKTLDDNELNNYCSIADPLEINEDDCWIKWEDLDSESEFDLKKGVKISPFYTYLGVPIRTENIVTGVLRVASKRDKKSVFKEEDQEIILSFANQLQLLFDKSRRNNLNELLLQLYDYKSEKEVFNMIVEKLPEIIKSHYCSIFKLNERTDKFELHSTSSPYLRKRGIQPYEKWEGKTGFTGAIGKTLVINYYGLGRVNEKILEIEYEEKSEKPNKFLCDYLKEEGKNVGIIYIKNDNSSFAEDEVKSFKKFVQTVNSKVKRPSRSRLRRRINNTMYNIIKAVPIKNINGETKMYLGVFESKKQGKRISETIEKSDYERSISKVLISTGDRPCETEEKVAKTFLSVPIKKIGERGGEETFGIIRFPRTEDGQIFTDCDVELVERISKGVSKAYSDILLYNEKMKKFHKDYISIELIEKVKELENVNYEDLLSKDGSFLSSYYKDDIMMEEIVVKSWINILNTYGYVIGDQDGSLRDLLNYTIFENLLRTQSESYREHLIHQFQVFLLGCYVLDKKYDYFLKLYKNQYVKEEVADKTLKNYFEFSWFLITFLHDFGYYIENVDPMIGRVFKDIMKIDSPIVFTSGNIITGKNVVADIQKFSLFAKELLDDSVIDKIDINELQRLFIDKIVDKNKSNHGVLSAFILYRAIKEPFRNRAHVIYPLVGVALHDWKIWRESFSYHIENYEGEYNLDFKIDYSKQFLTFLLILCDIIQEWGRPRYFVDPEDKLKNKPENRSIKSEVLFDLKNITYDEEDDVFTFNLKIDKNNRVNKDIIKKRGEKKFEDLAYNKRLKMQDIGRRIKDFIKKDEGFPKFSANFVNGSVENFLEL